jgi:hypothetical protein
MFECTVWTNSFHYRTPGNPELHAPGASQILSPPRVATGVFPILFPACTKGGRGLEMLPLLDVVFIATCARYAFVTRKNEEVRQKKRQLKERDTFTMNRLCVRREDDGVILLF